ncbi:hypothetical protein ColTof4_13461 [Colletotrichum tofieldiae]|nr:hypothetical protein ColTof3_00465 [Colletotrichum tofieldiae]GKT81038.1 hypothetical protein ColTof4_13461 [Colletotrichum tofieldiae]GKT88476.1 hypothetical protein Ct61P_06326 [Colletotrichum tofieldiae]
MDGDAGEAEAQLAPPAHRSGIRGLQAWNGRHTDKMVFIASGGVDLLGVSWIPGVRAGPGMMMTVGRRFWSAETDLACFSYDDQKAGGIARERPDGWVWIFTPSANVYKDQSL